MACTIGVLMPIRGGPVLGTPSSLPIGRAMAALAGEGIRVVLGHTVIGGVMTGFVADGVQWASGDFPLDAAYDRFPSQSQPDAFAALCRELGSMPVGNPAALTELCRDKLACQRLLEDAGVPMPAVVESTLDAHLQQWGQGFLKPRHGSFGRGVRQVVSDTEQSLPVVGAGAVRGETDQLILQQAVPPPAGWAGVSVRQLVQRGVDGQWTVLPAALRRSRTDSVVNVARDAEVAVAADVLSAPCNERMRHISRQVCEALGSHMCALELGLDFVVDPAETPWLIEVNSRPRGRLRVLAEKHPARFADAHLEACCRPFRVLASLVG